MNYKIDIKEEHIIIKDIKEFNIEQTLECGQCFNFNKISDKEYVVVAFQKALHIKQVNENLCFYNTTINDFNNIWKNYFDLETDYSSIKEMIIKRDETLKKPIETLDGMRIMNQEFFETMISFIISQNKQIPHIKQIIKNISQKHGKKIANIEGEDYFSFPSVEEFMKISEEELRDCKTGFRAPYIKNAVTWYHNKYNEEFLNLGYEKKKEELVTIKGIGEKVANCILLFGLSHREAFPIDVWIKRVVEDRYFDEPQSIKTITNFAIEKYGELGGYAQQYLFYYGKTQIEKNRKEKK